MSDSFRDLAARYYNEGQLDKALAIAKYAVYFEGMDFPLMKVFGQIQQAKGEHRYAIGAYQKALLFNCHDPQVAFYLAQCYAYLQEWPNAVKWAKNSKTLGGLDGDDAKPLELLLAALAKKIN